MEIVGVMQNKLDTEELMQAVEKRGVKCEICKYVPEFREEFQLRLINDKLTCSKCEEQ